MLNCDVLDVQFFLQVAGIIQYQILGCRITAANLENNFGIRRFGSIGDTGSHEPTTCSVVN
ncbi:hypothetical protein [Marinobacter gelidimuriae]|uniref:hypothetical protein n=1 Tax=Marinobacter gelidimuriae TaxID=2739064 RepID=UPI00037589F4|nr:hypothetical protein [Marinobacter gelidimuriae]